MFEYHRWLLILRDEQVLEGEDDYPDEISKMNAKAFILDFPNSPSTEYRIPEGHKLIFKRTVRIHMGSNGEEESREHMYKVWTEPIEQK
jgi:hypothetical protein